jgi:hypothetical protein
LGPVLFGTKIILKIFSNNRMKNPQITEQKSRK